ncbi:MAG: hypothetical protein ACRETL_14750, partial [Gammaproteobacteria bacterium]
VFDLWWLCENGSSEPSMKSLRTRLSIYPAPSGDIRDTAQAWIASARARLAELKATDAADQVAQDLKRWLPSSWPMDKRHALPMLERSIEHLKTGIEMMRQLVSTDAGSTHD